MTASKGEDGPRRIYARKLLGVTGPECTIPHCRAPGRTTSTGWLELGSLGEWCLEFTCPDHGALLATGDEWRQLIAETLGESLR
jgi:hypothetical protein